MSKNKKFSPIILIPIFVAIFVLIVLAVSGHLTRTEDIKEPTAETSVSAVNEQNCKRKFRWKGYALRCRR